MLGGLRALVADRVISRFQTQKTGALLAYLASHPGQTFHREYLASLLWPEGEASAVRNRLNQAVSSLRRQLHPPGSEANAVIVADHLTLAINPRTVGTDLVEFRELLRRSETETDERAQIDSLTAAVNLYRGEFLHGFEEPWIRLERVSISDHVFDALSRLIKLNVSVGRLAEAIDVAGRRLAQDPYDERSHRALMRLFILAGRPRSAIAQFEELKRILGRQGLEPSSRAKRLYQDALSTVASEPKGTHSLAHLRPPPAEVITSSQPLGPDWSMPTYLSPFFGRDEEINVLADLLGPAGRLVTIVGLGGSGKTRLAIEFARKRGNARFLTCGESWSVSELDDLVAGSHDALVVLDESDAIRPAELAKLRAYVGSTHLRILATARSPLLVEGEIVVPLSPLPLPYNTDIAEIAKNPAVCLFVDRAQAVRQDFQLTDRTAAAILELCHRLEGWPLALELCASWARCMTPSQMAEQLAEKADALASRRRDIPSKHRSLRVVLDSTFEALSPETREALGRWSVLESPWDYAAAAALVPGQDVHALLDEATSSGLLRSEEREGQLVHRFLQPVRQYLRSTIAPDLLDDARFRHAEHFRLRMARLASAQFSEFSRVDSEHADFLAAFLYYIGTESEEAVATLGAHLGLYWDLTERHVNGLTWMERALPLALRAAPSDAALFLARFARLQSHSSLEAASRTLAQSMELFARADDVEGALEASFLQAHLYHQSGNYAEARAQLDEVAHRAGDLGLSLLEARAWLGMGNALVELGQLGEAAVAYERSMASGDQDQNVYVSVAARGNMGYLLALQGKLHAARAWLNEALSVANQHGLVQLTIDAHLTSTRVERQAGALEKARWHLAQSNELGLNDRLHGESFLRDGAALLAQEGRWKDAAIVLGLHARYARWKSVGQNGVLGADLQDLHRRVRAALGDEAYGPCIERGAAGELALAKKLILSKLPMPSR